MNIRGMQGGFKEAMANAKVIEPTMRAVIDYMYDSGIRAYIPLRVDIVAEDIMIVKSVYDSRNGWNTHMVLLNGFPVAYIDGNITKD